MDRIPGGGRVAQEHLKRQPCSGVMEGGSAGWLTEVKGRTDGHWVEGGAPTGEATFLRLNRIQLSCSDQLS